MTEKTVSTDQSAGDRREAKTAMVHSITMISGWRATPAAPMRAKPVSDTVAETAGALPTAADGKRPAAVGLSRSATRRARRLPSPRPFSSVDARVVEANVLFWRGTLELRGHPRGTRAHVKNMTDTDNHLALDHQHYPNMRYA